MSNIILPRLQRLEFHGFQPLLDEPVTIDLPSGPFLILGGNGLGKTTILQSTVYALAGTADDRVEEDSSEYRWGLSYFHRRFNPNSKSEVIVSFSLGSSALSVRRDFKASSIRGLKLNDEEWINDSKEATELYERLICEEGSYATYDDFRYIVHRLCYLAENRRTLLWDQKAQVRTVMLVSSDSNTERHFRDLSKQLKLSNSDMRHRHVDITHLEERIALLDAARDNPPPPVLQTDAEVAQENQEQLQKELLLAVDSRAQILTDQRRVSESLKKQNEIVEELQDRLSKAEERHILKTLQELETSNEVLALNKMLTFHKCPYCTKTSERLAAQARRNIQEGNCPICGQIHITPVDTKSIDSLRKALVTETDKRSALEAELSTLEDTYSETSRLEADLRARLEKYVERLPRIPKNDKITHTVDDAESLRQLLIQYRNDHKRLQVKVARLQAQLDAEFKGFTSLRATSLRQLQKLASEYGTAFLGDPCEFVPSPVTNNENLTYFVPRFQDEERTVPTSCSESERFFLDIAFRMAVIDLSSQLTSHKSTFICETPENALDLAYTDNVADMFNEFCAKDFSLFLSANIQEGGVALPILRKIRKSERTRRILNLIKEGNLTTVQFKSKSRFEAKLKKILNS